MEKAIITTSWDDGHPLDLKLAGMLAKYDIPATFYLPVKRVKRGGMDAAEIREIGESYDVGGHTYNHVHLPRISGRRAKEEIFDGKKKLEEITGREVVAFSYPYGEYNDGIVGIVREAGFIGARTVKMLTREISDPYRMGSTIWANDRWFSSYMGSAILSLDFGLFIFMLKKNLFFAGWDRIAVETLDFIVENGGIWHLWGHSWEIDNNADWGRLDAVLRRVSSLSAQAVKVDNSRLLRMRPWDN